MDAAAKLAVLVEGALAAGVAGAQLIVDADGKPATLTRAGSVVLLRVIGQDRIGTDRIDCFLTKDDDFDDDGETRLGPNDRLFSLQERGAAAPELVLHNHDVKAWLSAVFLALTEKAAELDAGGGEAGHA